MHPPLDRPHPECQAVIIAFRSCQEERTYGRWFGACSDTKTALDQCFKEEKNNARIANGKKKMPKRGKKTFDGPVEAEYLASEEYKSMMDIRALRQVKLAAEAAEAAKYSK
jgi:COX assembly protein 2